MSLLALNFNSCKKTETAKDASISLKLKGTSTSSITFEITTEDAKTFSYAVAKSDEIGNAEYTTEEAVNDTPSEISISELEENTEYTIRAYAENAEGKQTDIQEIKATTNTKPSISVAVISTTHNSVTFKLTPVNAVAHSFAVAENSADLENIELEKHDGGEEAEYTVSDLEEDKLYSIVASATGEDGSESARTYTSFRTNIRPILTIEQIEAEYNSATVKLSIINGTKYAYTVCKKGESVPDKTDFSQGTMTEGKATIVIQDLEELTDYTFHAYGIGMNDYAGDIVSKDFSTTEYIKAPFEIKAENITSTNADIIATFDSEIYSGYYFIAGTPDFIVKEYWDWEKILEQGWSDPQYELYNEDKTIDLRNWGNTDYTMSPEQIYHITGIPVKKDGTVDKEAVAWLTIQLKPVVTGESNLECTITENSVTHNEFRFKVSVNDKENAAGYYITTINGKITNPNEYENYIKSLISKKIRKNFDSDTSIIIQSNSDYTFLAIAKDKSGKLGKISGWTFTSKSVDYEGDARCQVSLSSIGTTDATFNCILENGTVKIQYYYAKKDQYYDENHFINSLKLYSYQTTNTNGEVKLSGLSPESEYIFGFCPVGDDGILGKCVFIEETTKGFTYDGNPDAKVDVTILSKEGNNFGGVNVKLKAVPNGNVSKYYIIIKSSFNPSLTKAQFTADCLSGMNKEYTGETTLAGWDGNGEMTGSDPKIWILPFDTDGKMSPIIETPIN